jgi:hypothetical protein
MTDGAPPLSSARVREILARLVSERQGLRREAADRPALEANRRAIVYWQAQLTRSLIAEHTGSG